MKNKIFYLIFGLIFISTNTKSQIEDLIISYTDTTKFLVDNGRRLILKTIQEKDYKKTKEIYQYLNEKTKNKEFKAFDYYESIYINMLIHDWYEWSELAQDYYKYSKTKTFKNAPKIKAQLYKMIVINNNMIVFSIESSDIDDEAKSVALILQHYLKNKVSDEKYNKMLDDFFKTYGFSKYELFIKRVLPSKSIKLSCGGSFGLDALFLTDNLNKNFDSGNLFSMTTYLNFGKIFISFNYSAGFFQLNNAFSIVSENNTFDFFKGEYFIYSETSLLQGYSLFKNERFRITPFVKIASCDMQTTRYNTIDEGEELYILNTLIYGPGLHTELKLFEFGRRKTYNSRRNNYLSIKVDGGYNFIHKSEFNELKGNSAYIGAALVLGIGHF